MWTDILTAVASGLVSLAALYGLFTWRREISGKARFEIARELVQLCQKLCEDFRWARFPISTSSEFSQRVQGTKESPEETLILNEWFARQNRLNTLKDDLAKMLSVGWQAEIILKKEDGKQIGAAIDVFRKCFANLASAVDSYFEARLHSTQGRSVDQEWVRGLHAIIVASGRDEFPTQLDQAQQQMITSLKRACPINLLAPLFGARWKGVK